MFFARASPPKRDQVRRWLDEIASLGYTSVRTGALAANTAEIADDLGFQCVQRLVLLEHTDPASAARRADHNTHRLLPSSYGQISDIDRRAFGAPWGLDRDSIDDVCAATPHHRARATGDRAQPVGYAIAGRDGRSGFLQRLAVDPDAQCAGHGRALVLDAMRWFGRWHVGRVLVNTHEHNEAALHLYHDLGFTDLDETLGVFERALP